MPDTLEMPSPGSRWRHYKGNVYDVLGECFIEQTEERAVLYRLTGSPTAPIWARPLWSWHEEWWGARRRFVQEESHPGVPAPPGHVHQLKVAPAFWDDLESGRKPFELRLNDRNYQVGHVLALREWTEEHGYSGRELRKEVTCVVTEGPWLAPGYVCVGLADV